MMEDKDDVDAKLKEEIEAELNKISISSLEKDVDSDSKSETQSDASDADLDELPESVLHCIDIIKSKSKTAEELILQDMEETDVLDCGYGAFSNDHLPLRIGLSTEYKENPKPLIKILSEIEKEEFLRSRTCCGSPQSVPEPGPHYLPVNEHTFSDDFDINFGYREVEERCRQSFESWQDKQKELEEQKKETLKAQRDKEEKEFQEEEEKRHWWMKQFEIEKKKLENIQKQEEDKLNDELHKEEKIWKEKVKQHEEFIRNLHLQMEEERTRFKDLQEKEKMRLLKIQHNAAIKIQAKYKAFVVYQKYSPIIREQIENKKRKAQEWKEKEARIRQIEEERKRQLEEEKKIDEEVKKQKQEEKKRRVKDYEEKKNILRQEKEQLLKKEKLKLKEHASKQLIISRAFMQGEYNAKYLAAEDSPKNKDKIAKKLGYEKSKKSELVPICPLEDSKKEHTGKQLVLEQSIQVKLKDSIASQTWAEFKMEEKNENLAKPQCSEKLVKQQRKYENMDKKFKLENPDVKENVTEQPQLQELKYQIQKEETMTIAINENMRREDQIILIGNQEIKEEENNEAQKLSKDNEQSKIQKIEEELSELNGTLYEEPISVIPKKQELLPLKLEKIENIEENVKKSKEGEIILKSKGTEENQKGNVVNSNVIFNTRDAIINLEDKINRKDDILDKNDPCEDFASYNAKNALGFAKVNSLMSQGKEITKACLENGPECERSVICSISEPTLTASIEEKRQAWMKSFKPWCEISKQNQQKKLVKKKRPIKYLVDRMPPLNALEILQGGPWNTLQQGLPSPVLLTHESLLYFDFLTSWLRIFVLILITHCHLWKVILERTFRREEFCSSGISHSHEFILLSADEFALSRQDMNQVTTVTFQDLPGCSLSTLAECTNLQFLSLQRCGLTNLQSLSNCKKLKYIDAQENHIESINCENLENLCVLLLNKNQLTSFHGLDGCTNIQNLELSYNKITRIGGLESLRNLQQLIVDHNQLISTKGLCDTPTIIYLDCSHNHLTEVEGIENCGLLQILNLQGNYLSELPSLENHVLLRELHLDDNSISTVESFSSYWLPLLQNLTISQNSLTNIIPLFHFISLEKLDVSNNCLSDLTSIMRWFNACHSLRELSITGNPLLQEINWRHSLLEVLPALRILNGEMLNSHTESYPDEHYQLELEYFLILCQSQIREFNLLTENYIPGKGNTFTLDAAENLCLYFKKLMTLSNEYRYMHEHGDVSFTTRDESKAQQNHLTPASGASILQNRASSSCEHNPDSPGSAEKWMDSGSNHSPLISSTFCEDMEERNQEKIDQKTEDSKISTPTKRIPVVKTVLTRSLPRECQTIEHQEKIMAAMVIQGYWRGYIKHSRTHPSTQLHSAARKFKSQSSFYIQNQNNSKKGKRENTVTIQDQREKAAILIQAVWKGFLLRKKLTTALEAIKNEESEEEYEEIDIEDFAFDEAALEKEWLALDSTRFPSQTLPLPNQPHWPKFSGTLKYDTSFNLPSHPAQAWLCNEKENMFSSEPTYFNNSSENGTLSLTPVSKTSRKSLLKYEKEEKISEEWGFKDISTAQQMLKRAQKMKSKRFRKKIDATVSLKLFKSSEDKVSFSKSPKKAQAGMNAYFEVTPRNLNLDLDIKTTADSLTSRIGKEQEFINKHSTANEKLERSKEYTYQWLHTQVGVHETAGSRNMKCNHFLPELDPDIRNGGRVQLVARLVSREDTDLDLFSMTSGSALSVKREKKNQAHRHSAGPSSCSIKGILAPMITNTRPSKKERISFRDNPVQLSGGWGSGKKKVKTSN